LKVLFISSGNTAFGISPIIRIQGYSLKKNGMDIYFFPISGKGLGNYIKNGLSLIKLLSKKKYDIIHAHYSFSAYLATLSGAQPLVVSLMGSDVKSSPAARLFLKLCSRFFWCQTIVKSVFMKNGLGITSALVIPNGVDTDVFNHIDKATCQKQLGWKGKKKHILFPAHPKRPEKNYTLAKQAVVQLDSHDVDLHTLIDVPHEHIPIWMNASDVILLPSLWEGSPNVIKEAMACNCPVVATDVGDVAWLFGDEPGHFLAGFDAHDVAQKIKMALDFSERTGKTRGRERIIQLGLDSDSTAKKIINMYKSVLEKKTII
jgi:glycosyltransferase involved in cell wall biosynthesis